MLTPKVLVVNAHAAGLSASDSLLPPDHGSNDYELMIAASREEALRQVREHEFAVILLNAGTPGIDCQELAEAIHSQPNSASMPIIFIGARPTDETDELKGYRKGAVDYLFAPVTPQILQAKVAVFVELARKNLQLQRQAREMTELNLALQLQRKRDLQYIAERQQVEAALRQSREELRMLAGYQERVKEDERKRIAREIHDDLGQNLLALRIDISLLYARSSKAHPKLNAKVRSVLDQIDVTIKSMRDIINNLRPTVLDLGLDAAIQWQVNEFRRRSGIACELRMDGYEFALDDDRATAVFRVLQESLCNIIRHACATRVEVDLHKDEHVLTMRVADNGVGSYPGCRRKSNSFGLVGMRERISSLGGELVIDSALDRGMTLLISIPLEHDDTGAAYEAELEASDGVPAASIVAIAKSTLDLQYGKNTLP